MRFGEILGRLMTKYGFSQSALANAIGVNRSTIKRYLNGDIQDMKVDRVLAIATAMAVSDSDRNALLRAAGYTSTAFLLSNDAEAQSEFKVEVDLLRQKGKQLEQEKQELAQQLSQRNDETTNISTSNTPIDVSNHQRLQNAYIKPSEVFERTSRFRFTGREWLLAKIDQFLEENDRGYFVLEANAGLGKTAFLVWLVQERKYIHHFCELSQGVDGITDGLRSIAAQLAIKYGLDTDKVLYTEPSRSDYLYNFLIEIAQQQGNGEKVVIVVDALDESAALRNQNVMGLPTGLPKGVYFIVSQRPTTVRLNIRDTTITACDYFELDAESEENQADMLSFLEDASTWPEIRTVLQQSEHQYTPEQFIKTLMNKCLGIWIYLYFVMQEIRRGDRSPLDLNALPNGMAAYYTQYWQRWRDEDEKRWNLVYLPLLTILAASQEALSCQRLIEWSNADISERSLMHLLMGQWSPFLSITGTALQAHYRFYHATLQEFFDGKLDTTRLSKADKAMIEELSEETRARHHSLAERYIQAWGGWEAHLKYLKDEQMRDLDDGYGLRHIVCHLESSGRIFDLHHLLRLEWSCPKKEFEGSSECIQFQEQSLVNKKSDYQNSWFTVRNEVGQISGYLDDIARALKVAVGRVPDKTLAVSSDEVRRQEWQHKCIGLQCRYTLIFASIFTIASEINTESFIYYIKQKIWSTEQSLSYARQILNLNKRALTLVTLAPWLYDDDAKRREIIKEAFDVIDAIKNGIQQPVESFLNPNEPDDHVGILRMQKSDWENDYKSQALANLIPQLSKQGELTLALSVASSIWYEDARAKAHSNIVSYLIQQKEFKKAQYIIDSVMSYAEKMLVQEDLKRYQFEIASTTDYENNSSDEDVKARATINPSHLIVEQRMEQHGQLTEIWLMDIFDQSVALAALVVHLAKLGDPKYALSVAESIKDISCRERALADLAPILAEFGEPEHALSLAYSIDSSYHRASALANLVPYLAKHGQFEQALSLAHSIKKVPHQFRALADLATFLAEFGEWEHALSLAHSIDSSSYRARALANLVPYLAKHGQLEQALSITSLIQFSDERVRAISNLAPYISSEYSQVAIQMAYSIENVSHRVKALLNLASHLSAKQVQETLSYIGFIEVKEEQAEALTNIASILAERGQPEEALAVAHSIKSPSIRTKTLANLTNYLTKEDREVVLQDALSMVTSSRLSKIGIDAIFSLSSHLSTKEEKYVYQKMLRRVCSIDSREIRETVLTSFILHIIRVSSLDHYAISCETIQALSQRTRANLLSDIVALSPMIAYLGKESAIAEIILAIREICHWWP